MARNALLPAYQMPGGIDVSGFSNALSEIAQGNRQDARFAYQKEQDTISNARADTQLGMQKRAADDAANERRHKMLGNMALAIVNEPDEAKAAAYMGKLRQSVPDFDQDAAKHGLDLNDYRGTARMLAARAGVLPDPLDRRAKLAEISGAEGRASLIPGQKQLQDLQLKSAQKEFENPKLSKVEFKPGESVVFYDPYTGKQRGEPLRAENNTNPELGPYKDMKQRADVEEGLRKEVTTAAKEYNTIRDAATSLDTISKAPSAAKDIAMVFSFMKILDPNSVVRETEYATAAKAAGLDDQLVGYITKIQNGQFLTPEQRLDFLGTAQSLARSRESGYRQNLQRYEGISQRLKVDPRNVIPEPVQAQPAPAPAPQAPQGTAPRRAVNPTTGQVIEWNGQQWTVVK